VDEKTADNRSLNDEKPSLWIFPCSILTSAKRTFLPKLFPLQVQEQKLHLTACCYVLALLGENQHIQARLMQVQEDIFSDDILRPVRSEDLPRMVYLEQVGN
jgi:hypothetical protein